MSKLTQSPWPFNRSNGVLHVRLATPWRAGAHREQHGGATDEAWANGQLAALAPDMLALLIDIEHDLASAGARGQPLKRIRELIARVGT